MSGKQPPTVAVIAPGNMGAAVGARLAASGARVLTSLEGRSTASRQRAAEAGMAAASDAEIASADFLLSIVPPGEALALAKRFKPVLQASNRKPVYVECNAVSPKTVDTIASVVSGTGCPFVDGGIIGPPPRPIHRRPKSTCLARRPGGSASSTVTACKSASWMARSVPPRL
jgi:3-hydroxyisobutyrate dehydrogenase-like beta-hydroxyacid dehydrogenase